MQTDKRINMKYKCNYCSFKFTKSVKRVEGGSKHKRESTSVRCPKCKNFLKTW